MPFEPNVVRLWRSLSRDARTEAARSFWERPTEEAAVAAAQEIVKILRVRPQAFHKIPLEQRVRAVAGLAAPPTRSPRRCSSRSTSIRGARS